MAKGLQKINNLGRRGAKLCGRILSDGRTCKKPAEAGCKRCKAHRGMPVAGKPRQDTTNSKHNRAKTNIYASVMSKEDQLILEEVSEIEGLNDEIAIIRFRINRCILAMKELEEGDPNNPNNTAGMQVEEVKRVAGASSGGHVISRRQNYEQVLNNWLARLAQLMKLRAEITGDGEQMSREELKDRILSDMAAAQSLTIGGHKREEQ